MHVFGQCPRGVATNTTWTVGNETEQGNLKSLDLPDGWAKSTPQKRAASQREKTGGRQWHGHAVRIVWKPDRLGVIQKR